MDLNKWVYNKIREVILEDFRYQYDKESFLPPPSVLDQVAKAYQYVQGNNLVSGTGGNEGSGLQKATALLKKEPLTHAQLKRMKAFFDNNYEAVQREKGAGKNITNSGFIQSWELWGGDYGREWANNRIKSIQDKNDRSKNLRPKGHKRMMDPTNTRVHDANHFYVNESNDLEEELSQSKQGNFDVLYKDNNLTVVVPKTYEACLVTTRNTNWCTQERHSYDSHTKNGDILIRFLYKDGYKLRLTILANGDYNGFHWGENSNLASTTGYYYLMGTDFESYFKPKKEIIEFYSTADAELTNERFFVDMEQNKLPYWKMLKTIMKTPKMAQKKVYEFTKEYLSTKDN